MADCQQCGATGQVDRFCQQCGLPVTTNSPAVTTTSSPYHPPDPPTLSMPVAGVRTSGSASASEPTRLTPSYSADPPPASPGFAPVPPPPVPPPPAPAGGRRAIPSGIVVAAVAAIVAVVVVVAAVTLTRGGDPIAAPEATAISSAQPPPAQAVSASVPSETPRRSEPGERSAPLPTVVGNAGTVPTAPVSTSSAPEPMGGPRVDIPCGPGYIVQVASELDDATFASRVATLRAAGQLPAEARWAETTSSCGIFTSQRNVLVLYAGPFPTPYDACPARLASPPDSFIKGTTPESSGDFVSCLCPAQFGSLPVISTVGQQDVWVGELQRVLGTGLGYGVGSINADPSIGDPGRWGIYTAETAAAVGRFQTEAGLPSTAQVDGSTWAALAAAACG